MSVAEKLLNSISATNMEAEDVFTDPYNGDVCKALYAVHCKNKRRLLVRVTKEYAEDVLNNKFGFDQAVETLRGELMNLSNKVKNQNAQFERENDFVFSR
jgi:hypothetical protein